MRDEISKNMPDGLGDPSTFKQTVERVDPCELDTVAKVLAAAYAEDPIHIWAMPKAATRLADATAFFTFFLRRMRPHRWEVFATADRTAVAIMAPLGHWDREYQDGTRYLPTIVRTSSLVANYFSWIEAFRPNVDHQYLEFIGCMPAHRAKGMGSILLKYLLTKADLDCIPIWSWSSNPRNLTFYRRLGFETSAEIRRDDSAPAVTPLWRPCVSLVLSSTQGSQEGKEPEVSDQNSRHKTDQM